MATEVIADMNCLDN